MTNIIEEEAKAAERLRVHRTGDGPKTLERRDMADLPTSPEETGAIEVHQPPDCDLLRLDYEQTLATHRQLVEIRFKLLAFLFALSAVAVALLTAATVNGWTVSGLGIIGFVVTLGLVIYDRRNSQFHDGSIGRAEHLEKLLNLAKFEKIRSLDSSDRGTPTRHFVCSGLT
jgi:hypothetical protein